MKTKLQWKKELPFKPGWYWRKADEEIPEILRVRVYVDRLAIGNATLKDWPAMEQSWWAGPIQPPKWDEREK